MAVPWVSVDIAVEVPISGSWRTIALHRRLLLMSRSRWRADVGQR